MPASTEKDHSVFAQCRQGSNAYPVTLMLLAVLLTVGTVPAQQRRIRLDDLAKVVTVSDPQIAPDGKSIVCVVSRLNFEEDHSDTELVLVEVATGAQRVLTVDRKDVGSPRWSPTGDNAQSPITHVAQIKTPTLIMSDTGDARVPISQSYQLYHALKDNGVPVKFVAYPVPGHFPSDPVRYRDVYSRWLNWLDQYLK